MGKSSVQTFLKSYDRYAKNVSLSYKRSGSFETSIGGICSIFSFTVLTYWLAVNIMANFAPPGKFSTSTSTKVVPITDDTYPVTGIPLPKLLVSYDLQSNSPDVPTDTVEM